MGALCCVKCTGSNLQGTSLSGKPVDTAMLGFTERAAVGGREEREGGREWMDGWMDGWMDRGREGGSSTGSCTRMQAAHCCWCAL